MVRSSPLIFAFLTIGGSAFAQDGGVLGSIAFDPPTNQQPGTEMEGAPSAFDGSSFIASRKQIGLFASTKEGDHEDAGILTKGGGAYGGIIARHIIYAPSDFKLPLPPEANGTQTLFAPTSRAPNGSCLEVGTAYTATRDSPTTGSVYVFDFCDGMKFERRLAINSQFLAKYTAVQSDGSRYYTISIVTSAKLPGQSANWNAAIFNQVESRWDNLYSDTGIAADKRGWTIFETWYQKGQCSKALPPIVAADIAFKNLADGKWEPVLPQMDGLAADVHDGANSTVTNTNCFKDDKTGPASYKFVLDSPDSSWRVLSTGH